MIKWLAYVVHMSKYTNMVRGHFWCGPGLLAPPPTSGAVNVVCFEWSVINRSVLKGNHTHFEREPYTSWQN